jgi:hypothetical protein
MDHQDWPPGRERVVRGRRFARASIVMALVLSVTFG